MNFSAVFVQGMMPRVRDLQASDLDGIVNWTPLLAAGEQQHPPHTRK